MGILYINPYEITEYEDYMLNPQKISLIQTPAAVPVPYTLCITAEGFLDNAFEIFEVYILPEMTPSGFGATGLFERYELGAHIIRWHATVKPYSWRASSWWELPAPFRVPAVGSGGPIYYRTKAFLVIVIGDTPTMTGNDPIYVSGEIAYDMLGEGRNS
jgi:hypothetical protein